MNKLKTFLLDPKT